MFYNIFTWTNVSTILVPLTTIAGGLIYVFVFNRVSLALHLRINATWIDSTKVILRFEVENRSRVSLKPKSIKLQILEYPINKRNSLSEWVPFSPDRIHAGEDPLQWNIPVKIFETTKCAYPNDSLAVDRLHSISSKNNLLHVGLQIEAKSIRLFPRWKIFGNDQWTTTAIIAYHK